MSVCFFCSRRMCFKKKTRDIRKGAVALARISVFSRVCAAQLSSPCPPPPPPLRQRCTRTVTGKHQQYQKWYVCTQCELDRDHDSGLCATCFEEHRDHTGASFCGLCSPHTKFCAVRGCVCLSCMQLAPFCSICGLSAVYACCGLQQPSIPLFLFSCWACTVGRLATSLCVFCARGRSHRASVLRRCRLLRSLVSWLLRLPVQRLHTLRPRSSAAR
jgi:hypothetical protein